MQTDVIVIHDQVLSGITGPRHSSLLQDLNLIQAESFGYSTKKNNTYIFPEYAFDVCLLK